MYRKADKTLLKTKQERLARDIIDFLLKHLMFDDTFIYVNGKRYGTCDGDGHYNYGTDSWDNVYVEDDKDPKDYFKWAGKELSMSFEGPLYDVLNYGCEYSYYEKLDQELNDIFKKHGYYFELGNSWNLTAVKL